jgi:hypothetical protein
MPPTQFILSGKVAPLPTFEAPLCRFYKVPIPWGGTQGGPREPKGKPKGTQGTRWDPRGPKGTQGDQGDPRGPKGTQGSPRRPKGTQGDPRDPREPKGAFGALGGMGPWGPLGLFRSYSEWKNHFEWTVITKGNPLQSQRKPSERKLLKIVAKPTMCSIAVPFGPKLHQMRLKLPIWNFWAALGPQCAEMIQNGTKTNPLEHLGGWARSGPQRLGPKRSKTLPKLSETKHLGFKRDPWPGLANLALRKGWLEDASEREPPSRSLQPTQK